VEERPTSPAARYYLGYAYYLLSQQDPSKKELARKAADEIRHAYRLDPGFQPAWGKE